MTIRFIGRAFAAVIAMAGLASTAQASLIDTTWTHTYNAVQTVNAGASISYTHDLTTVGFTPGDDWIDSILLTVDLRDDAYDPSNATKEWAKVAVDLLFLAPVTGPGTQDYTFEYGDGGIFHFIGLLGLNSTGLLDVTISSVQKCEGSLWNRTCTSGDFVFGGSTLVAKGKTDQPTRVPEPAVLGLFGLGLIAVAIGARRRKAKNN